MNKDSIIVGLRNSSIMRKLLTPAVKISKHIEEMQYLKLPDSKIIAQYKNIYPGKRCFVIGNGPSLTVDDLEKLNDEITFATNGIFHVFEKTLWRPTFYMSMDNSFLDSQIENIKREVVGRKFLNFYSEKYGRQESDDIVYFLIKGPYVADRSKFFQEDVSEDVSKYFAQTFSVTTTCIEFAIYMGIKEIYLLGVDNNFTQAINTNNANIHFYSNEKGLQSIVHYAENQIKSYELYREFGKKHGCQIYNATRGGMLEVFPRINLDTVLEANKYDHKQID
ncbi:MAG: DUF115 domain-containing protein [Oscillospiraceae bacterium]|nr:DUF115 domain-containing protein [Oscillospiraceae bacterium]